MKPCKLVKLGRVEFPFAETELRLNMAEGKCSGEAPVLGSYFSMFASSPNPDAFGRLVSTSIIRKIEKLGPNSYRFETMNSIYELEIFDG